MDMIEPPVHLNLNVRGLGTSATLSINERSAELIAAGRDVFRLGLGQSPFPVPAPVVAALREHAAEKDYLPVKGLRALREAVAGYHHRRHGVQRHAEDVLVGPGSKELMFLVQLAYYGDLVIPTPSWVSYAPQAQIIGRHVRWVPTDLEDNWQLDPEGLEQLCTSDASRPRLVILNYPHNPTGHTYSAQTLEELADVARRYKVLMLSDEIYSELHHEGEHVSIAHYYPEGTIVSSGLSKWCGAGGWRLGTFTFPRSLFWLRDAMAAVASETYTTTSAPIQHAAVTAFRGGEEIESYLRDSRRVLRALGRHSARALRSAGLAVKDPSGAFYLFPSFTPQKAKLRERGIRTSAVLCERLLDDTGVATIPGSSFGHRSGALTLRLAYVDFDGAACLRAAHELGSAEPDEAFLREHCPRVTEAIDRMCEWTPRTG